MSVSKIAPGPRKRGAGLLLRDIATTSLLLNEGRRRLIRRIYGGEGDHANTLTVISLLLLPGFVRDMTRRLVTTPQLSNSDLFLIAVTLRELFASAAGPVARETPGASTLLTLSLLSKTPGFGLLEAERGTATASHWLFGEFRHRYGYLVDPGHRRERRAQRRARASGPSSFAGRSGN
jgi:hypothetical protein